MIFTIRNHKVIIDADLAALYNVPTKALNQAVKRNANRFPRDFIFRLTAKERLELVTHCDHPAHGLHQARSHHGSHRAKQSTGCSMSVFAVRAFVRLREHITANHAILKRLAEIDRTLLAHDSSLLDLYEKLLPLLQPPPDSPARRKGFQSKGKT